MRQLSTSLTVLAAVVVAAPAVAQTKADLKRELKQRLERAQRPDDKVRVANWAKARGLVRDHKAILEGILKNNPEHPGAMEGLGYVRYEGKWIKKKDADKKRMAAIDAEYRSKGLKKVESVWVEEANVDDAKKGIFHHDDEIVSRDEKLEFLTGKVRHPRTGMLIAKENLSKAENGMFPLPDGKWVDEAEANKYHNSLKRPWVLRTYYCTLVTNLPIEQFDQAQDKSLKTLVDSSFDLVKPLFGGEEPNPEHRPVIAVCNSTEAYVAVGNGIGSEGSAYGAFYSDDQLPIETGRMYTKKNAGVANWGDENWGPYFVRHATGLALAHSFADQAGVELPSWFVRGAGSLPERFPSAGVAAFFGKQHLQKGGVKDLDDWFDEFQISGELDSPKIAYNVFQSGLVLNYAMHGGDGEGDRPLDEGHQGFADPGRQGREGGPQGDGPAPGTPDSERGRGAHLLPRDAEEGLIPTLYHPSG